MKEVEIFDDENSITFSDEQHDLTLDFYPDTKEFKSTLSLREDVYRRNELYEYKLTVDPVEVSIRLIERSDEPPEHFVVKDGVVLETEIKENNKFLSKDFINDLKKDVQWNKLKLTNSYVQFFYIISKHSEIVSKNEYKKILRETEQKIKNGLLNIEKRLKEKDAEGLAIINGEYGSQIWFTDSQIWSTDNNEVTEKRKETSKKIVEDADEFIERNFTKPLFDIKSPQYCGISKDEFGESSEVLKHIDKLLNEKEGAGSETENDEAKKKNPWRWIGYVWTVIINLITIGVVLAIYGKVYESFEIIVVSILILIYLSFQGFSTIYGQTIAATAFGLDTEFKRIRKLLKDEPNKHESERIQEVKKKVDQATIKMYINAAFLFVIYLIALFNLFSAL